MTGKRIGYIRVSTFDQNPERQLEHVDVDRIFSDKASGRDVHRPQLEALMDFVREGDTVIVHSMDRLARNRDRIQDRCQELVKCYETLNRVLPLDKSVRIEQGNVVVSPTEAEAEPPSVTKLKNAITERLPRIHLTDLMIEVDRWVGFRNKFNHAGGQNNNADDLPVYIHAAILAQATNLGLHRMATVADLSYQRLVWCTNWYLRDQTLDIAAGKTVNPQGRIGRVSLHLPS